MINPSSSDKKIDGRKKAVDVTAYSEYLRALLLPRLMHMHAQKCSAREIGGAFGISGPYAHYIYSGTEKMQAYRKRNGGVSIVRLQAMLNQAKIPYKSFEEVTQV